MHFNSNEKPIIIAIDGYSASGKGTLAKRLAKHFSFEYLDTGILYRIIAYHCLKEDLYLQNKDKILSLTKKLNFNDIADKKFLHDEAVSQKASEIAQIPDVRSALLSYQKNFPIGKKGVVLDGRDIGTVIFPNAICKIFVIADINERAKRRFKQLQIFGKNIIYNHVLKYLKKRDERDKNRALSPLKKAKDAFVLDTTHLTEEETLNKAIAYCNKKILN